jgi:hypothetical protein
MWVASRGRTRSGVASRSVPEHRLSALNWVNLSACCTRTREREWTLTEHRSPGDVGAVRDALRAAPVVERSRIAAAPVVVWERVATRQGINDELMPLLAMTPGQGFLECSSSLLHREWIHERRLAAVPGGTEITDRVHYQCRLPGLGLVLRPVIRFVFRHRHRRLLRRFGTMASQS